LKDSTAKQHQKDTALQLVRSYQKDILQLERQHHAQIKEVNGNMRHLEEQLRRYKVESVPPAVTSPNLTKAQRARALKAFSKKKSKVFEEMKRNSNRESNADLTAAVSSSLRPYSGLHQQQQPQRSSFTMASSIMMQHQFFPALLSAVASNVSTPPKKR
jgi:hypothetical protein